MVFNARPTFGEKFTVIGALGIGCVMIAAKAGMYLGRIYAKSRHLPIEKTAKAWVIWSVAHTVLQILAILIKDRGTSICMRMGIHGIFVIIPIFSESVSGKGCRKPEIMTILLSTINVLATSLIDSYAFKIGHFNKI